jgi:hypothetical protein
MPVTLPLESETSIWQCGADAEYRMYLCRTGQHDARLCKTIRTKWQKNVQTTIDRVVIDNNKSSKLLTEEELREKRFNAIMEKLERLHPVAFFLGCVVLLERPGVLPDGFTSGRLPEPMSKALQAAADREGELQDTEFDVVSDDEEADDALGAMGVANAAAMDVADQARQHVFELLQVVHIVDTAGGQHQPWAAIVVHTPIPPNHTYIVAFEDGSVSHSVTAASMQAATPSRGPVRPPTLVPLEGYKVAGRKAVAEWAAQHNLNDLEWAAVAPGKLFPRAETRVGGPLTRSMTSCGGQIYFPSLVEIKSGKRVCFAMGPDDVIHFVGAKAGQDGLPVALTHGTLRHHAVDQREAQCTAHVSGVAQHDCALLRLSILEATALTKDTQLALQADVLDPLGLWADAEFIEVEWNEGYWPIDGAGRSGIPPRERIQDLVQDPLRMLLTTSTKCVVIDLSTKLPIICWASAAGPEVGSRFRTHLQPMATMPARRRFRSGNRSNSGFEHEFVGVQQRMEMIGNRVQGFNKTRRKRPVHKRPKLVPFVKNNNKEGDICAYVNAWDEFDYWFAPIMMDAYKKWAETITSLFPRCSAYTSAVKALVDVERRAYTEIGVFLEPSRVLGESVGFSADYASVVHNDPTDVMFTTAVAGKCGHTVEVARGFCGCDVRGCAAALFNPKRNAWRCGVLFV